MQRKQLTQRHRAFPAGDDKRVQIRVVNAAHEFAADAAGRKDVLPASCHQRLQSRTELLQNDITPHLRGLWDWL